MKDFLFTEKYETKADDFFIVQALNADEAYLKAAKSLYKNDDMFIEDFFCRAVNMCFAERFWMQTDEEHAVFNSTGEIIIDVDEFIKRVKDYFGSYKKAADDYLYFWFLEADDDEVQSAFDTFITDNEDFLVDEWMKFADLNILDVSKIKMIK